MTDLLAARSQMALSLGFHIIFACIGMAMPFFMATSHYLALKRKDPTYKALTKAWSKGVAIFFATGAVSGTALSFELGLLWPEFMKHAGAVIGMPFSWEGTAFFIEAIALGLFLYGWDRMPAWAHWLSGLVVGVSGVASGVFVVCANAWMNSPAGFDWVQGKAINIDPFAAMFNQAWIDQSLHMTIAAFEATGFAVAGMHALLLLKKPGHAFHQKAIKISLAFACVAALIQPLSGDLAAKGVHQRQPLKLAAMEAHFETRTAAPLLIGGIPDMKNNTVNYALKIPGALSFLATGSTSSSIPGLKDFPRALWPPVPIVHFAFQTMVGLGSFLALVALISLFFLFKKPKFLYHRRFLQLLVLCLPLGFVALEAGWVVTEVGRQPWIIYGIMKTKDALTPMPGLVYTFGMFCGLYLFLTVILIWLVRRQIQAVDIDNNWSQESHD